MSLEQQVLLMKVSDKVKDKALMKLKEVKSKADDQGNKSKQYLEGLVRVPWHVSERTRLVNGIIE